MSPVDGEDESSVRVRFEMTAVPPIVDISSEQLRVRWLGWLTESPIKEKEKDKRRPRLL